MLSMLVPLAARYIKVKSYERKINAEIENIQERLYQLEDVLEQKQNNIYKFGTDNWAQRWNKIGEIKRDVKRLSNEMNFVRGGTISKKTLNKYKRTYKNVLNVSYALEPIELSVEAIDNKIDQYQLTAIDEYVSYLDMIYKRSEQRPVDFNGSLNNFENKYPKTVISAISKQNRIKNRNVTKTDEKAVSNYINQVHEKLMKQVPDYYPAPEGMYAKKLKPKFKIKRNKVSGKYKKIVSSPIHVNCYATNEEAPLRDIIKTGNKAKRNEYYVLECQVINEISDEYKDFIEDFTHSNMSLFAYEMSEDRLYYNSNNEISEIFSAYFDPQKEVKSLHDMLLELSKDKNTFLVKDARKKLNMNKKSLKKLEKLGYVFFINEKKCGILNQ